MKALLFATTLAAIATVSSPASAADVGVSISVGQPGFYGQLNIGGYPQPQLLYPQPVIIQPAPRHAPPLYLRVPPGHAKHWSKHCREYNACGRPVYFVQESWYNNVYVPRYREHGEHRDGDRHEYREERGERRGNGHDNGHGHGKGRRDD